MHYMIADEDGLAFYVMRTEHMA